MPTPNAPDHLTPPASDAKEAKPSDQKVDGHTPPADAPEVTTTHGAEAADSTTQPDDAATAADAPEVTTTHGAKAADSTTPPDDAATAADASEATTPHGAKAADSTTQPDDAATADTQGRGRRTWYLSAGHLHLALAILTLLIAVAACFRSRHPRVTLNNWGSDHHSHISATLLFLHDGLDIYRLPINQICDAKARTHRYKARLAQTLQVPAHTLCWVKGGSFERPLSLEWQQYPRFYPPGTLLYFMPEALLYRSGASFHVVCVVAVLKMIAVSHVCVVLLSLLLAGLRPRALVWGVLFVAYSVLIHWSLEGMYDGLGILWILLGMLACKRRRHLLGLVLFSASAFFHFRALWYVPLFLAAAYWAWRSGALGAFAFGSPCGRDRTVARPALALIACALLVGASAGTFLMVWPALGQLPLGNHVYYKQGGFPSPAALGFGVVTLAACVGLALHRLWLALIGVLWLSLFLLGTPWIRSWYAIHLLPLVGMMVFQPGEERRAEGTVLVLLWSLMTMQLVMLDKIWPTWLADVPRLFPIT